MGPHTVGLCAGFNISISLLTQPQFFQLNPSPGKIAVFTPVSAGEVCPLPLCNTVADHQDVKGILCQERSCVKKAPTYCLPFSKEIHTRALSGRIPQSGGAAVPR